MKAAKTCAVSGRPYAEKLIAFMLYQGQLQEYVNNLLNAFTSMYKSSGAAASVFDLMDRTPIQRVGVSAVEPFHGAVALSGVHFAYPARAERPVLNGLTLRAEPGQAAGSDLVQSRSFIRSLVQSRSFIRSLVQSGSV